jgi:hypothetical protein
MGEIVVRVIMREGIYSRVRGCEEEVEVGR